MTRTSDIKKIRELLQRRRRDLLEAHQGAQRELTSLKDQDRDPEFEESAQTELADYTLSSVMESQRTELRMIDAAISRMAEGSYGECVDCGDPIPMERLEALPFALRCAADASRAEQERMGGRVSVPTL